jgi:hypothetical protein
VIFGWTARRLHDILIGGSPGTEADAGTVELYRKADIMRHRPAVRMDPHPPALVDALLSAELFGFVSSSLQPSHGKALTELAEIRIAGYQRSLVFDR